MADVGSLGDGGIVVYEDEVDMVRCPTDHENENNYSKHLHNLKYKLFVTSILLKDKI